MDKDLSASPARLSLGEAILAAVKGRLTQRALADRLGVHESTVGRWIKDEILPTIHDLPRIEDAVKEAAPESQIKHGDILRALGLVEDDPDSSTEARIARDLRLTPSARRALLDAVEGALRASADERKRRS